MRARPLLLGLALGCGTALPAEALETDQFYAWTRPLEDATDAINHEVNDGIEDVLARVNTRRRAASCTDVANAIHDRFKFMILSRLEPWVMNTGLVARAPANADEEARYKRAWLYGEAGPLDPIRWMPPSPTIEVAGVRIGTDKLSHFLSGGGWAGRSYRRALGRGASDEAAVTRAMKSSITAERTVLGQGTSGIFSPADLEASIQGLKFYRGLCGGAEPRLVATPGGWSLERRLDLRDYVTPEWDESWQPNVYSRSRWAKVQPVMRRYCGLLRDAEVQMRRTAYAARDRETPTEVIIQKLVAAGSLADPAQFTIEAACDPDAHLPK